MTTARTLISDALRLLRVLGTGQTAAAEEAADGLRALNAMLDGWANERLTVYVETTDSKALTSGDGSYTIGAGGDINTGRPPKVNRAYARNGGADYAVEVVTQAQWDAISQKSLQGDTPCFLWYESTAPLGIVHLWPLPGTGWTLYLVSHKPLASLSTLDTSLSLPAGYERALRYNLALELAPEYGPSAEPSVDVRRIAAEAKAGIKRTNWQPAFVTLDPGLLTMGASGGYDITSDRF